MVLRRIALSLAVSVLLSPATFIAGDVANCDSPVTTDFIAARRQEAESSAASGTPNNVTVQSARGFVQALTDAFKTRPNSTELADSVVFVASSPIDVRHMAPLELNCSSPATVSILCVAQHTNRCRIVGLNIRLSGNSCGLLLERLDVDECAGGQCLEISLCSWLAMFNCSMSCTTRPHLDPRPERDGTFFLDGVVLTYEGNSSFFRSAQVFAKNTVFACQSAPCHQTAERLHLSTSNNVTIHGFFFNRCVNSAQPTETGCFLLTDSSNIVFNRCTFQVSPGSQAWLESRNSIVTINSTAFIFTHSNLDSDIKDHPWSWPVSQSFTDMSLNNVTFDCSTVAHFCRLSNQSLSVMNSRDVVMKGFLMESCSPANCILMEKCTDCRIEDSLFRNGSRPFLVAVDSQLSLLRVNLTSATFPTFAPSGTARVWFPDYYRPDSYSGAVVVKYFAAKGLVFRTEDVIISHINATNDTSTRSWGLGGAIFALFMENATSNVLNLTRTRLEHNYAGGMGGCLFVAFDDHAKLNQVYASNTTFDNCSVGVRAGAVHIVHTGNSRANSLHFVDVLFHRCAGHIAAGAFNTFYRQNLTEILPSEDESQLAGTTMLFEQCRWIGNTVSLDAAAFQIWSFIPYSWRPPPAHFVDCIFLRNSAGGEGAVVTYNAPLKFSGMTTFLDNDCTGIFLTHAGLLLSDNITFMGNVGKNSGGGMGLMSNSFVYSTPNLTATFSGNRACRGPAIYIDTGIQHGIGAVGDRHSTCTFEVATPIVNFVYSDKPLIDLRLTMGEPNTCPSQPGACTTDNTCRHLGDIYISSISDCIEASAVDQFRNGSTPPTSYRLTKRDSEFLRTLSFVSNKSYHLMTDASDIVGLDKMDLTAFPGQIVLLNGVHVLDENGLATTAMVLMSLPDSKLRRKVHLVPDLLIFQSNRKAVPSFIVYVDYEDFETLTEINNGKKITIQFTVVHSSIETTATVSLKLVRCPPAFTLYSGQTECKYNGSTSDVLILGHNLQTQEIYLKEGYWGYWDNKTNQVYAYPCPLYYCTCQRRQQGLDVVSGCVFNPSRPNDQCNAYREGYLCGACKDGYVTLLFSPACRRCSSSDARLGWAVFSLFLVGSLTAAGLVLVMNVGLSPEMVGVLFFLQVAYYTADPGSRITTNWARANPDVDRTSGRIFSPCIGGGLTAVGSVAMNYMLLAIGVFVIIFVYLISRRGLVPYLARHSALDGVWLLFLLTYTSNVDTVLRMLRCVIANPDGTRRFYYNGEIKCLNFGSGNDSSWLGWGIFSQCLFIIFLPVPILVALLSFGFFQRLKPFKDIIEKSYRHQYRWWSAVDLGRRFVLAIIYNLAPTPQARRTTIAIGSFLLVVVHTSCQPFQSKWINVSETFILLDFVVLAVLGADGFFPGQQTLVHAKEQAIGYILFFLPILYGVIVLARQGHKKWKTHKQQLRRQPTEPRLNVQKVGNDNSGERTHGSGYEPGVESIALHTPSHTTNIACPASVE